MIMKSDEVLLILNRSRSLCNAFAFGCLDRHLFGGKHCRREGLPVHVGLHLLEEFSQFLQNRDLDIDSVIVTVPMDSIYTY